MTVNDSNLSGDRTVCAPRHDGKFRSLKMRILIPIGIACIAITCAISLGIYFFEMSNLENRAIARSRSLAQSTASFLEDVHDAHDIQHIIEVIQDKTLVTEITVAMRTPLIIVGSTRKEYVGLPLQTITDNQTIKDIMFSISTMRDNYMIHEASGEFSYTVPLICHDDECPLGRGCSGAVMVHIDFNAMMAELTHNLTTFLSLSIIGILLLLLAVFLSLERLVIRPLLAIQQAVNERQAGKSHVEAAVARNDEIGNLAHTLNETLHELTQRNQQVTSLFNNVPGAVFRSYYHDGISTILFISDHIHEISGVASDILMTDHNNSFASLIQPQDSHQVAADIRNSIAIHGSYDVEYRIRHADGGTRWIHERGVGVKNGQGEIEFLDGVITDITKLKEAEEKLRSSEERFALVLQGTRDGIWDWDLRTNAAFYSNRFRELLDCGEEHLPNIVESFMNVLHHDDANKVLKALNDHLTYGIPFDIQFRMHTSRGDYKWFRGRAQAIWDDNNTPIRLTGALSEVTTGTTNSPAETSDGVLTNDDDGGTFENRSVSTLVSAIRKKF